MARGKRDGPPSKYDRTKAGNRRAAFAREYAKDGNATQAAIRAGYSPRSATAQGSAILQSDPEVRELVAESAAAAARAAGVSLVETLTELRRVLLVDPLEAFDEAGHVLKPLPAWPPALRRALSGLDVLEVWEGKGDDRRLAGYVKKVRFWSKTEAAQQLLRVLGAFQDKLDVNVKGHAELLREAMQGWTPPRPALEKPNEELPS